MKFFIFASREDFFEVADNLHTFVTLQARKLQHVLTFAQKQKGTVRHLFTLL